ncbi:MAG: hypothetical protein ACPKQO_02695 [Nitrososphaeraceae archaeon]
MLVFTINIHFSENSLFFNSYAQENDFGKKEQERKQLGKENFSNSQIQKREHNDSSIFDSIILNSILTGTLLTIIGVSIFALYKIYKIRTKSRQNLNKRK